MWAISRTAWSKAAWLAWDGLVAPLTLRTYCSAAALTSSRVAGGSKLWSGRMLRHMPPRIRRRPSPFEVEEGHASPVTRTTLPVGSGTSRTWLTSSRTPRHLRLRSPPSSTSRTDT